MIGTCLNFEGLRPVTYLTIIKGGLKMSTKKWLSKELFLVGLVSLVFIFMFSGCAVSPKGFDPNIKGPQMIVEPPEISLGVAKLTKTPVVFKGKGFQPEDSVFITMIGVKKNGETVDVPIADGDVDKNGFFTAKVGTVVKVSEFLNAKIGSNKKMENVIVVSQPPIDPGTYTARAVSMESDKIAVCKLVVKAPSMGDSFKDWMGVRLGKIEKK
jgi:hypothetical protein